MKISLNWIRDFVEIPDNIDAHQLGTLFTSKTAEIEGVENQGDLFANIVVGQIQTIQPHPNADKLRVTKTNIGKEVVQIVCGASNIHEGQFVPVALVGAKVRWHGEGELVTLEKTKIRDVESLGMICAASEIGLEDKVDGILDLGELKPEINSSMIGMPLAKFLEKNDTILTVDNKSLTHRPDLWGHYGIAREIAAITEKPLKPLEPKIDFPKDISVSTSVSASPFPNQIPSAYQPFSIEVKDKKLCPRYLGVMIEGIKIEPSPQWLQNRISTVGYRPINNIVDITNYVMAELGQPMHAFDADKIEGGIIVRKAKKDEEIQTLDGTQRKLSAEMLVIADHKKPLAIAGVMGGKNSEISQTTTKIFIESANFNPSSVRKTSVQLNLRTEAVQRFEKSLDPLLAETAMNRICELILQVCPTAKITTPKMDIKNFKEKNIVVKVNLKKVFSKIGAEIPVEKVIKILTSLEFKVELIGKDKLKVKIPSFRATKDISIEDDLVEEIARMHGYENIEAKLPELPIKLPIPNKERTLKHLAREILALGLGFEEVYHYSFYNLQDIDKCSLPPEVHIKLQNYLSEDQTHLRITLIPNMLKSIAMNLKSFDHFKFFEIGRTYEDLQEYFPKEEKKICAVIVKNKKDEAEPFYEIKGALEQFLKMFHVNLNSLEMRKGESLCPYAHPNRYAGYYVRATGEEIARIFELHPIVAKHYDLEKAKIAAFELNFTKLAQLYNDNRKYRPIPKFPGIKIDVSVLINKNMEIGKIQKTIASCDRALIQEVKLFDLYEGANIPADKKALAFQISLQSPDRTLTDQEMKTVQEKIFAELIKLGGEIRGLTK